MLLCVVAVLSGCSKEGNTKTENITENTAAEKEAEKEIEEDLQDKYDVDFDIYYITEINSGDIKFAGYAYADGDKETQVSFYQMGDGSIQDNYGTLEYKSGIEDMIQQSKAGISVFDETNVDVVQLNEEKEYKDIDDYVKNGNYSVTVNVTVDMETPEDDIINGVLEFEKNMYQFGLDHSVVFNEYMTFDMGIINDEEELTEDYVRMHMMVDETAKQMYEERLAEEEEMSGDSDLENNNEGTEQQSE